MWTLLKKIIFIYLFVPIYIYIFINENNNNNNEKKKKKSNIKIDEVYGKKNGGLFYHSLSDASSGYITINNGTFSNFHHHGKQQSSLFIWTKKNMEISLRE